MIFVFYVFTLSLSNVLRSLDLHQNFKVMSLASYYYSTPQIDIRTEQLYHRDVFDAKTKKTELVSASGIEPLTLGL